MFHSPNVSNVNPCTEISVAEGVRCPSCETAIRAIDAEMLVPWGFRIACRSCSRDIVACEPARQQPLATLLDVGERTPF
jgi:hypothetical protein